MKILRNSFVEGRVNTLGLKIVCGGYVYAGSDWQGRDVCSPYSRLFFVTQGEARITVSGQETLMRPGNVYFIPIGVKHDYSCDEHMEKLWFHINMELYDGTDLFSGLDSCYVCPIDPIEVEAARAAYLSGTTAGSLRVESLIYASLSRLATITGVDERPVREYSPLLKALFPIVRTSISSRMTTRRLAERLNVSESTLTKRFRAETGLSLGHYLDDILMQRARQLLLTDQSIAEIAEQLEFCDQFYFSRFFRQRQNETPSRYRRTLKAQL
jgi:AraC-like DNA-binding protein